MVRWYNLGLLNRIVKDFLHVLEVFISVNNSAEAVFKIMQILRDIREWAEIWLTRTTRL